MENEENTQKEENTNEKQDTCPICGTQVEKDTKFCPTCGYDLKSKIYCPKCGNELTYNDVYCTKCGEPNKHYGTNNTDFIFNNVTQTEKRQPKDRTFLICALFCVLSIFGPIFDILGLVFEIRSLIYTIKTYKNTDKKKFVNGIIICAFAMFVTITVTAYFIYYYITNWDAIIASINEASNGATE